MPGTDALMPGTPEMPEIDTPSDRTNLRGVIHHESCQPPPSMWRVT
jgi:hypothetical protein